MTDMTQYGKSGDSDLLKAADIAGKTLKVTVEGVDIVNFGKDGVQDEKPALRFIGKDKGVALNKTNTGKMIAMYGSDDESWIGKEVMLSTQDTEMGPGIVVTPLGDAGLDDDVPF